MIFKTRRGMDKQAKLDEMVATHTKTSRKPENSATDGVSKLEYKSKRGPTKTR